MSLLSLLTLSVAYVTIVIMTEAILQRLNQGDASAEDLAQALGVNKRTVFRYLNGLIQEGKVVKIGFRPRVRYAKAGTVPVSVVVATTKKGTEPPLFSLQVTNPVTYLKRWWSRVMANEGVDVRFRIRPLTMIAVSAVLTSGGFVFGRISLPEPIVRYIPQLAPSPSPSPWKETAFTGVLQSRGGKYYLTTGEGEAIALEIPKIVNVQKLIGRKILAIGSFNGQTKVLKVADASDVEILVGAQPVPLVASESARRTNESQ